jgi:hypothetical protein
MYKCAAPQAHWQKLGSRSSWTNHTTPLQALARRCHRNGGSTRGADFANFAMPAVPVSSYMGTGLCSAMAFAQWQRLPLQCEATGTAQGCHSTRRSEQITDWCHRRQLKHCSTGSHWQPLESRCELNPADVPTRFKLTFVADQMEKSYRATAASPPQKSRSRCSTATVAALVLQRQLYLQVRIPLFANSAGPVIMHCHSRRT